MSSNPQETAKMEKLSAKVDSSTKIDASILIDERSEDKQSPYITEHKKEKVNRINCRNRRYIPFPYFKYRTVPEELVNAKDEEGQIGKDIKQPENAYAPLEVIQPEETAWQNEDAALQDGNVQPQKIEIGYGQGGAQDLFGTGAGIFGLLQGLLGGCCKITVEDPDQTNPAANGLDQMLNVKVLDHTIFGKGESYSKICGKEDINEGIDQDIDENISEDIDDGIDADLDAESTEQQAD